MARYMNMNAGEMLEALGDDAMKWAEAFRELHPEIEQDVMFGWFANAIEHSHDVRVGRLCRDDESWLDFQESIFRHRATWKDLGDQSASEGSDAAQVEGAGSREENPLPNTKDRTTP